MNLDRINCAIHNSAGTSRKARNNPNPGLSILEVTWYDYLNRRSNYKSNCYPTS